MPYMLHSVALASKVPVWRTRLSSFQSPGTTITRMSNGHPTFRGLPFHAAASVFVFRGSDAKEILLVRHAKFDRWMIPGGHVDPGEEPWMAAEREVLEETGYEVHLVSGGLTEGLGGQSEAVFLPAAAWVCVETIPPRVAEPEHRHIDYLFVGLAGDRIGGIGEGNAVWFPTDQLPAGMFESTRALISPASGPEMRARLTAISHE